VLHVSCRGVFCCAVCYFVVVENNLCGRPFCTEAANRAQSSNCANVFGNMTSCRLVSGDVEELTASIFRVQAVHKEPVISGVASWTSFGSRTFRDNAGTTNYNIFPQICRL
jgi:hypothetical protein